MFELKQTLLSAGRIDRGGGTRCFNVRDCNNVLLFSMEGKATLMYGTANNVSVASKEELKRKW
jgi:hypothetical protein